METALTFKRLFMIGACAAALAFPAGARAQGAATAPPSGDDKTTAPVEAGAQAEDDQGVVFRADEPDFTLISLPTALPLGKFKSAVRVTHRFTRPLNQGSFGELASDFFSLDNGAQIGLEYRFGIFPHAQVGIHRTSDRTIEFFSEYEVLRQGKLPFGISAMASVDGTNNFKDNHSPALGAIVSYRYGGRVALYVEPTWVNNSNPLPQQGVDHNDTFMVGVGARVRIRPTVYLVAEAAPRASGYRPDTAHRSFAIEKHLGGHMFQLNFSDSFGTTMGQIARGGPASKDWFMGYNISRKFY